LPGRQRVFMVRRSEAGRSLIDLLRSHFHLTAKEADSLLQSRHVWVNGRPCADRKWRVQVGQRVRVSFSNKSPAPQQSASTRVKTDWRLPFRHSGALPVIRFLDDSVVVVEKPAGLTTMRHAEEAAEFGTRARRYLPPTLAGLLPTLIAQKQRGGHAVVRAVHRLDKDTSGLVVFARTIAAESNLGRQFRAHSIERTYLAVVRGRAQDQRIESWIIRDRGDGRRGSANIPGQGQRAITHVRVKERLGNFSLVECSLETGRTHQVRIHLAETGTPLCGDHIYDRSLHGAPAPDGSGAKRIALHAATLGFDHPITKKRCVWHSPVPEDMIHLLAHLRARAK
jgi:23S rRNA pseudouridine1911/1915/1917 synthase